MRAPRFHLPGVVSGRRCSLPEHSARHAREVLRLRTGGTVGVFDGDGHEYDAELVAVTRHEVALRVGRPVEPRPESPLHLVLAVSPLKGDRMEWIIQKATELGVTEIWPVVSVRTDAAARPAVRGTRRDRWEKVAAGAAEQCGRATLPRVAAPRTMKGLLTDPFQAVRLLFDSCQPCSALAGPDSAPRQVLLAIGPPGGWEPGELDDAQRAGFRRVTLGPRVLRTETAAVTAVALAQALWGDLGPSPDDP